MLDIAPPEIWISHASIYGEFWHETSLLQKIPQMLSFAINKNKENLIFAIVATLYIYSGFNCARAMPSHSHLPKSHLYAVNRKIKAENPIKTLSAA